MEKTAQLYEGKAKKVYATDDPSLVIVFAVCLKATAFPPILSKNSTTGKPL